MGTIIILLNYYSISQDIALQIQTNIYKTDKNVYHSN